jgi:hypothetical protein
MALLYLDLERGGWSAPRPGRFTPGKDPVPIVQEAGWARNPACSQSLHRLSYPAHNPHRWSPIISFAYRDNIDSRKVDKILYVVGKVIYHYN